MTSIFELRDYIAQRNLLNPRDVSNFQARAQKRSKKPYFLWEAMS